MHYVYKTHGTCASQISLDIENNTVTNVQFIGGCDGNLKAIPRLVDGLTVEQVLSKCGGVTCGRKSTSCADQLACAVREAAASAAQ